MGISHPNDEFVTRNVGLLNRRAYNCAGLTLTVTVSRATRRKQQILWPKQQPISTFQALANRKEASPHLQQKLINMVGGDREKAENLVTRARFGRPGKSENYYWWKAIEELEQKRQQQGN